MGPLTRNVRFHAAVAIVLAATAIIRFVVCLFAFSVGSLLTAVTEAAISSVFVMTLCQLRCRRDGTGES